MAQTIKIEPRTIVTMEILVDEDWNELLPQFLDLDEAGAEIPFDLTGAELELYIRPTFDHATLIKKLSTRDGSIILDNAAEGLASIYVERPTIINEIAVGTWSQFLLLKEPSDDSDGFAIRELWRGPFVVHPARTEFLSLDFSDPVNSQYLPLIGLFGG